MRRPSVETPFEQRMLEQEDNVLKENLRKALPSGKVEDTLTEIKSGEITEDKINEIRSDLEEKGVDKKETEKTVKIIAEKRESAREEKREKGTFLTRLLTYIPADLIAAYIAIAAAVTTIPNDPTATFGPIIMKVSAVIFVLITFFWVLFGSKGPEGGRPRLKWFNASMATIAFAVWAVAIYGSRIISPGWPEALGTVLIIASVIFIALAERINAWFAIWFIPLEPKKQPSSSGSATSDS